MTESLTQRSQEWHDARVGRITASRVPAILGYDPYRTADDVLREMVREYHGYPSEFTGNAATQWGIDNEDRARADYEGDTGNWVDEVGLVVHPEHDWLAASPDGLIGDDGYLEIKCPYSGKLEPRTAWEIQVQFGLHVTQRSWGHLYIWTPSAAKIETIVYQPDFLRKHGETLFDFIDSFAYETKNPAHLEPLVVEREDEQWANAAALFAEADKREKEAAADKKAAREKLIELAGDKATHGGGVKVTPITKSGGYDYRKAAEAAGVDLEQYKKPDRTEYRVTTDD